MRKTSQTKRATLQDVAREAGVAPMTVSRMINGHPYVTSETSKKIREAIRKLNYKPNHAARMLTGKLSRSIGLIVPDISDAFFSVVSHAVQETARANNYLVWLAVSEEDIAIEAAQVEAMTNHPVDGILMVPCESRNPYLKNVVGASIPIVTIDRPIEVATTDSVGVENRAGARHATEHLIQHGNRRIACIATNAHLLTIRERIAGYKDAMKEASLPFSNELVLKANDSSRAELAKLLASPRRPDALFTTNNIATTWVIEELKRMNLTTSKDIALVGFDDIELFSLITPSVTAVRQPAAELGNLAARLLLQRITGELNTSSARTVLPVELVIRESCGCRDPGRDS